MACNMANVTPMDTSEEETSLLRMRMELYGVYTLEEELRADLEKYHVTEHYRTPALAADDDENDNCNNSSHNKSSSSIVLEDSGLENNAPSATSQENLSLQGPAETTTASNNNHHHHNNNHNGVMMTRQQTSSDKDIWGNFPLKEAREPLTCPECKRSINSMRFAMHLDKCMGIGSTVRSAAAAASSGGSTRNAGIHSSHKAMASS